MRQMRRRSLMLAAALGAAGMAACGGKAEGVPPMPALRADGTRIVDEAGQEVVLRGVNLGGWLFHETWITQVDYSLSSRIHVLGQKEPFAADVDAVLRQGNEEVWGGGEEYLANFTAALAARIGDTAAAAFAEKVRGYLPVLYDDSDLPLRQKLSQRFGDEVRDQLLDVFQEAWIGEADIAWIAAQGFNVVRVPITYRSLVTGPDLQRPTSLSWNERTWRRIARLLDWCERYRLWVVLDLQESPGGHNDYSGPALLYGDPLFQDLTVQLWREVVARFGEHSAVAAYSLLAEPYGAPDPGARDWMYDRLVKAIREMGDDHLLVIHDGFFGMQTLPVPGDMGWTNVLYSTHIFEFSARSYEDYDMLVHYFHDPLFTEAQTRQGVPYYMASFSTRFDEDWAYEAAQLLVDWFTSHRWSWSVWTYKRIDDPISVALFGKRSSYGVRTLRSGEFTHPDVFDDDLETLRFRLAAYGQLPFEPNERLLQILASGRPIE